MVGRETARTDDEVGRLILISPVNMSTGDSHLEVVSNPILNVEFGQDMIELLVQSFVVVRGGK